MFFFFKKKKELEYWKLNEANVLPCCWLSYSKSRDNKHILTSFDQNFFSIDHANMMDVSQRKRVWSIFQYPHKDKIGYIYSFISAFFILLSLSNVIFISYRPWYVDAVFVDNETTKKLKMISGYPSPYFKISDIVCITFFTLEFLIEIICCPSFRKYLKCVTNWISFVSLIVYYIQAIPLLIDPSISCYAPAVCTQTFERVLSILQFIRMARLIKLFKYYTGMRVMAYTLKSSFKELILIVTLLLSGVTVFGSLIFAAEGDPENIEGFPNIPISFWFAMTTMTTVGFGDRVPSSTPGYIIGSMCAICGVLVVAFTVPIAVNNFTFFYSYTQSRIKYLKLKKRQIFKA